jgi:hypothetical protein
MALIVEVVVVGWVAVMVGVVITAWGQGSDYRGTVMH